MPSREDTLVTLTIAGSDSSGGAGIQADLKTFAALGSYGASVITALTAQNTLGVQGVHPATPDFVELQIRSVLDDVEVHAIKTGMLFDAATTRAVARMLKVHYADTAVPPLVCDPVCASTSGHTLLQPDAVDVMIEELFPLAALITPNKYEAEVLLSRRGQDTSIANLEDMLSAARRLLTLGPSAVLLKGGHVAINTEDLDRASQLHPGIQLVRQGLLEDNMEILRTSNAEAVHARVVVDVLSQSDGTTTLFIRPHIDTSNTHGTGCTLSAALACELGWGADLVEATRLATAYTHLAIETASRIGQGNGPLNHLHSVSRTCVPRPTSSNPHPFTRRLIQGTAKIWKEYVEHDFVKLLGKGTLPREKFKHFIKQDYQYLKYYGRAYGYLAAKSHSFASMESCAHTMLNVVREISTHKAFCAEFGITEEELEKEPEALATTAYGCYLIETGVQGDSMKLLVALLACLLGYGEVGLWLKRQASQADSWVKLEGNPYIQWIDDYSGEPYQSAVRLGLETIEARAAADPPSPARFEEWRAVWEKCTLLEKGFWDMAMAAI